MGLMGVVAHSVYDNLGEGSVLGIIPKALRPREITGDSIGELQVVPDMHTRKVHWCQHTVVVKQRALTKTYVHRH